MKKPNMPKQRMKSVSLAGALLLTVVLFRASTVPGALVDFQDLGLAEGDPLTTVMAYDAGMAVGAVSFDNALFVHQGAGPADAFGSAFGPDTGNGAPFNEIDNTFIVAGPPDDHFSQMTMDFSAFTAVSDLSFRLADIDAGDIFTAEAFDANDNLLETIVLDASNPDPGTGDGVVTTIAFAASGIAKVKTLNTRFADAGHGIDDLQFTRAISTVPDDPLLGPGDPYRLVFVTSGSMSPESSDIADYNTFVQAAADAVPALASLGATWTVIGSTETTAARDNTGTNPESGPGVPIYSLDGRYSFTIADDNQDLWDGYLDYPLEMTEWGTIADNVVIYTGSTAEGFPDSPLYGSSSDDYYLGASTVRLGFGAQISSQYTLDSQVFGPGHYYAISSVLTVEAPSIPGDGNGDGTVDGLDYLLWAGAYGTHPGADGDISDGDYNDDGWVDGLDYLLWAGNYGSQGATTVPEPSGLILALLASATLLRSRQR